MADNLDSFVDGLEKRAAQLRKLVENAPRPFIIEFAGTPKSGKSTSVEAIRHFFTRQGFKVHVLVERASVCPIPMKGHLFFNTWCASTMLAELLANIETAADMIIVDRGLFDALVWLTLQQQRGELTASEAKIIEAFLLLPRWRNLVDLPVVMSVSAEEAITRENNARVTTKPGSIMNPEVLNAITASVRVAIERYRSQFRGIVEYETSGHNIRESNAHLISSILDQLKSFADPEILVVPRKILSTLPLIEGGQFSPGARDALARCISDHGRFSRRSEAELDDNLIQIVACGILIRDSRVFVFERKERDPKYKLYGKSTIWQGCHVPRAGDKLTKELIRDALLDRITQSLFLSRAFPLEELGYCWEKDDPNDSQHFGIMFRVEVDNENTAVDLRKKEFRSGRGHGLSGGFVDVAELLSRQSDLNLEPWSVTTLRGARHLIQRGIHEHD
jgi:predicted NUDIX family phosphoesterase